MKYQIDLYTMHRPHLADSLTVEAQDKAAAIEQARKDPRVVSGILGLHSIFPARDEAPVNQRLSLPTAGYGPEARAFNNAVRAKGHGVVVQGREWMSFGRTWIRFSVDGRERRITWPQFNAGAWA